MYFFRSIFFLNNIQGVGTKNFIESFFKFFSSPFISQTALDLEKFFETPIKVFSNRQGKGFLKTILGMKDDSGLKIKKFVL